MKVEKNKIVFCRGFGRDFHIPDFLFCNGNGR